MAGEDHQVTLWDLALEEVSKRGAGRTDPNRAGPNRPHALTRPHAASCRSMPRQDPEATAARSGRDDLQGIPPQLFFVHQGQTDIKEIHGHAQLPGVLGATASDSFHMFKPANSGDGPAE